MVFDNSRLQNSRIFGGNASDAAGSQAVFEGKIFSKCRNRDGGWGETQAREARRE